MLQRKCGTFQTYILIDPLTGSLFAPLVCCGEVNESLLTTANGASITEAQSDADGIMVHLSSAAIVPQVMTFQ
jgi:hypothetical protein